MTPLQAANRALLAGDHAGAVRLYAAVLQRYPALAAVLRGNLARAQRKYRLQRMQAIQSGGLPRVIVHGWDLSSNAAGRMITLADTWKLIAETRSSGFLYPGSKSSIWRPLQNASQTLQPVTIIEGKPFIEQLFDFVVGNPCDLLHLSKPRLPNILLGGLYKLVWGCSVVVDIDDDELAFVRASSPVTLDEYLAGHSGLPSDIRDLWSQGATRLAVGLATAFDGVTVCNAALQERHGGRIVRHARDAKRFASTAQSRQQARAALGIDQLDTVIVFAGTPRAHKGLLETARAITEQQRNDLIFLIAGSFPRGLETLRGQIARMSGLRSIMLSDQSLDALPGILAAGDLCILLQDAEHPAARYQTPAKLSDALAVGLTVLATDTPGLSDLAATGAFTPVPPGELPRVLGATLAMREKRPAAALGGHLVFTTHLSVQANAATLRQLWQSVGPTSAAPPSGAVLQLMALHPATASLGEWGPPPSAQASGVRNLTANVQAPRTFFGAYG